MMVAGSQSMAAGCNLDKKCSELSAIQFSGLPQPGGGIKSRHWSYCRPVGMKMTSWPMSGSR